MARPFPSMSGRLLLRVGALVFLGIAVAPPAAGQLVAGVALGGVALRGDGVQPGISGRAFVLPLRLTGAQLGLEVGLDVLAGDQDSVPATTPCFGLDGQNTRCSFRVQTRHRVFHVALATRIEAPRLGFAPFAEFGLGVYFLTRQTREDTWAADGTYLPNLSSRGYYSVSDPGLGLHGGLGVRYRFAGAPLTITTDLRGRITTFLVSDLRTESRHGAQATVGVSWAPGAR